jgi:prephenate dehydrogenase
VGEDKAKTIALMFNQLGVIGCGLMGGSFALALRRAGLVKRVIGYSKSPSTTERARKMGVIDLAAESALLAVSGSDIVIMAVPVAASETTFRAIRHLVEPNVLFMDVGSTKRDVVDAARRVLRERIVSFVPAHPIAGKEASGIEHADAQLFAGRQVILTPLPQTNVAMLQKATDVWAAVGAQVLKMSPENHDAAFAAVSHLPHLLAFAYFGAVVNQPAGRDFLSLAGPGFRDFTRIAASSPEMWRDILVANREEILKQSQLFRHALTAFEQALQTGNTDALESMIRAPAEGRAAWQMGSLRVPAAGSANGTAAAGAPGAGGSGGAAGTPAGGTVGGHTQR